LAHKLILGVAATLMVSATLTTADSQELIFSPNISGGSPSQFDQTRLPEKSGSAIKQDDNSTNGRNFHRFRLPTLIGPRSIGISARIVAAIFRKFQGSDVDRRIGKLEREILVWQYLLQNPNTEEPSVTLADRLCIG
jgi:hypothetical protein